MAPNRRMMSSARCAVSMTEATVIQIAD